MQLAFALLLCVLYLVVLFHQFFDFDRSVSRCAAMKVLIHVGHLRQFQLLHFLLLSFDFIVLLKFCFFQVALKVFLDVTYLRRVAVRFLFFDDWTLLLL